MLDFFFFNRAKSNFYRQASSSELQYNVTLLSLLLDNDSCAIPLHLSHDIQKYKCRFRNIVGIIGGMEIGEVCKMNQSSPFYMSVKNYIH